MTQHFGILKQLLKNVRAEIGKTKPVLAVFDLDSTLFDVSPRIQKILEDLRDHPETVAIFPEVIPPLMEVRTHRRDWGIKAALVRAFENQKQPSPEFHKRAREFWSQHFFSNDYLHFDHPVEGAVDFVNTLFEMGADVAYLTGRDWNRMGPGTVEVLKKWNFPTEDSARRPHQVRLAMKPIVGADDSIFKSGWFTDLNKSAYSRILFFENEPKILHRVMVEHPEVELFFLDTTHSGKAEPHVDWIRLPNFLREESKIQSMIIKNPK
jgi:hypothetical protein